MSLGLLIMCTVVHVQHRCCHSVPLAARIRRRAGNHKQPHGSVLVACAHSSDKEDDAGLGIALATGGALALVVSAGFAFSTDIEALIFGDGLSGGLVPFGVGGITASVLWSISLWFASPLQLLVLFLGKIETERPSDWFMNILAGSLGLPIKDLAYEHPAYVRAAAVVFVVASGAAIANALDAGLGSSTWGVSSGIATCMAAGIYELGRPERLSADQAVELEGLYQLFVTFAEQRLKRGGRCHESEIQKAFKAANPSFVGQEEYLRDMVSSWYPQAQRTPSGYYKNVSLVAKVDPFTGKA